MDILIIKMGGRTWILDVLVGNIGEILEVSNFQLNYKVLDILFDIRPYISNFINKSFEFMKTS